MPYQGSEGGKERTSQRNAEELIDKQGVGSRRKRGFLDVREIEGGIVIRAVDEDAQEAIGFVRGVGIEQRKGRCEEASIDG